MVFIKSSVISHKSILVKQITGFILLISSSTKSLSNKFVLKSGFFKLVTIIPLVILATGGLIISFILGRIFSITFLSIPQKIFLFL